MIGIVVVALVLWFFGYCASCYSGPIASTIEVFMKGASIIAMVCFAISSLLGFIKNRRESKEWKANNPTRLPYGSYSDDGPRNILKDTPENRKKLMAWNEKNFRRNPQFIYPGPKGENWQTQQLRHSLFTPEQMTAVPLKIRVNMRSKRPHSSEEYPCRVCSRGRSVKSFNYNMYWQGVSLCQDCYTRYQKDKANGWSAPKDFSEAAEAMLWMIQQKIAMNLLDKVITEATAKAEMQEAIKVVREEMTEVNTQERNRRVRQEQEKAKSKTEQEELSRIVRDFRK